MIVMGKIKDYTISETKQQKLQVAITFEFQNEGKAQSMTWFGSLNEGKAREITYKTLKACGLRPENSSKMASLVDGIASGLLDLGKELSLDIQDEFYMDEQGVEKNRKRIAWVNDPEDYMGPKPADKNKISSMFNQMGFAQEFNKVFNESQKSNGHQTHGYQAQGQQFNNGQQNMNQGYQGQHNHQSQMNQNQGYQGQQQNMNHGYQQNQGYGNNNVPF